MPLIDLKYTPAERKEEKREMVSPGVPEYPWGLSLSLENETLSKLGLLDPLPEVGGEIHMTIVAKVTGVNHSATMQEDECRVGLTVCMAEVTAVESAAEEKGEPHTPAAEAKEMAGKKAGGLMGKY